jgi:hypothetical protein
MNLLDEPAHPACMWSVRQVVVFCALVSRVSATNESELTLCVVCCAVLCRVQIRCVAEVLQHMQSVRSHLQRRQQQRRALHLQELQGQHHQVPRVLHPQLQEHQPPQCQESLWALLCTTDQGSSSVCKQGQRVVPLCCAASLVVAYGNTLCVTHARRMC